MTLTLTKPEQSALKQCEAVIKRGSKTFLEVGDALLKIRDARLYRVRYGTFQEYCEERWQFGKTQANRLIQAVTVVENLTPIGAIQDTTPTLPATESVARPLARLPKTKQREAWKSAVKESPDGKPTAALVQKVVDRIKGKKKAARWEFVEEACTNDWRGIGDQAIRDIALMNIAGVAAEYARLESWSKLIVNPEHVRAVRETVKAWADVLERMETHR